MARLIVQDGGGNLPGSLSRFLEGCAPDPSTVAKTAHTLDFPEMDAFPGLNGEIMITVYQGNEYWEFTLQPTETITLVYERDDETVWLRRTRGCPRH
jgi:hypothetical protein